MMPGMAFGSMGIAGVGLEDPTHPELFFIDEQDGYFNQAPLSRAVSMATLTTKFSGPAFDRQSQFLTGSRHNDNTSKSPGLHMMKRSHSMNDLHLRLPVTAPDLRLHVYRHQPFTYLPMLRPMNGLHDQHPQGSLGAVSDDFQRLSYKDVAL